MILESWFYQTDEYAHYKSKYGKSSLKKVHIGNLFWCDILKIILKANGTEIIKHWNVWNRVPFSTEEMKQNTVRTHSVKIYTSMIFILIPISKSNPTQLTKLNSISNSFLYAKHNYGFLMKNYIIVLFSQLFNV